MGFGAHWPATGLTEEHVDSAFDKLRDFTQPTDVDDIGETFKSLEERVSQLENSSPSPEEITSLKYSFSNLHNLVARKFENTNLMVKELQEKFQEVIKQKEKAYELELQRVHIEKSKVSLERWKIVVGVLVVFISGILVPLILNMLNLQQP